MDVLIPCMIFSKSMQNDVIGTLTGLLKTPKEADKLASKPFDQWSTYAATMSKCTTEEDGNTVYQMQKLKGYSEAESYFSFDCEEYCHSV